MGSRQRSLIKPSTSPEAIHLIGILDAYMLERGMRTTEQRRVIIDALLASGPHVSIEQLTAIVKKDNARIGYATVYRTLKMLTECGVVHERHFDDGIARYELARTGHHHDHLICTQCGRIVEFENRNIESLQRGVAAAHGFRLTHHRHELYGVCHQCDEKCGPGLTPHKRVKG